MELRYYQASAVDAAWSSIRQGNSCCLVLPTGSGKSLIIAELIRQCVEQWGGRAVSLAHRKELLTQNAKAVSTLLPKSQVGIYSAGLKLRDVESDIVVAGIQSVYSKAFEFGERHVCIVDECHRIGKDDSTQYQRFLTDLRKANPNLAVIGVSATPFRTGEGEITNGIFDEIAYEASISDLMGEGFLCRVTNKPGENQADMSKVSVRRGDFVQKQMEDTFLKNVHEVCTETIAHAEGRKSIIIFCSGVEHAEQVADAISGMTGEEVGLVTGETLPLERASVLERFRTGKLRWMVNVNVLTEGFDAPGIDMVAVMRATVSPGLFAQAVGRGFRLHPDKENCLILDFGGNIERHGAIDDPQFGRKKKFIGEEGGEAPTKTCEECGEESPAGAGYCWNCLTVFEFEKAKLSENPDTQNDVITEEHEPEWLKVNDCGVALHKKRSDPDSRTFRVDYYISDILTINEYVCIEHTGYARDKAKAWWREHSKLDMPDKIEDAVDIWQQMGLRVPSEILAKKDGRWWRIVDRQFTDEKPDCLAEAIEQSDPFDDPLDEEPPF